MKKYIWYIGSCQLVSTHMSPHAATYHCPHASLLSYQHVSLNHSATNSSLSVHYFTHPYPLFHTPPIHSPKTKFIHTHISLNLSSLSTLRRKKKNKKRIFLFISSSPPPPKTTLTTTIHRRNLPINLHPIKPLHQQLHRFTFKSLPSTPKSTRHSQIENPRRSSHHRPTTFYSLRRRPVHHHFFKILPITGNRRIKPNGASAFSSDLDSR